MPSSETGWRGNSTSIGYGQDVLLYDLILEVVGKPTLTNVPQRDQTFERASPDLRYQLADESAQVC